MSISLDQKEYSDELKQIEITNKKNKDRALNNDEQYLYRKTIGQLNWLASQSRPDLSFDVCKLSVKLKSATVRDALLANKVVKKAKATNINIKYQSLKGSPTIVAFCDASYANLPGGESQGGAIIFLADDEGNVSPLS